MPTAVVTDSTSCLTPEQADDLGVRIVPLSVVVDGTDLREGVDVDAGAVAAALRAGKPVSTSAPSPATFLQAYTAAAEAGADSVVSVHMSAALSSTSGSAALAARSAPVPVSVVDSRALGMVMGYAVTAAARAASSGATPEDVVDVVRRRCERAHVVFYVDTLEHLRRGGRIGRASAFLGSALAIKPILALREGAIVPLEKVRTASRAIARLEELAVELCAGGPAQVAVHHLGSLERASALAERLRARLSEQSIDVDVVELGAAVGAHVGPGTLAVAVTPLD